MINHNQKNQPATIAKASQTIIVADSLDIIWRELNHIDPATTLVVFDVDYTLIKPSSLMFASWEEGGQKIKALAPSNNKDKQNFLISKFMAHDPYIPVEEKTLSLIRSLQAKNIRTIALTGATAGPYGCIESMMQWRLAQFNRLGISFTYAFPQIKEILQFHCHNHGPLTIVLDAPPYPAVFYNGVIFSGYYDKGESLEQFLALAQWTPQRIIFADDLDIFVHSVEAMCRRKNIDFLGIHYHGAEQGHAQTDPLLSAFQLQHLAEHEEWLNDTAALALMHKQQTQSSSKSVQP